jgi:DNA-binding CsgD family transcriptional regulator
MPDNENDKLATLDREHRKHMEQGSRQLLEAILYAKRGYNPGTREAPLKLPPDYTEKRAPDYAAMKGNRPDKRPSNERIKEMMERGLTSQEIAAELKCSRQKITAIMKAIKLERRPDRQMEMIRTGLWG